MVVLYLRNSGRSVRNLYNAQHCRRKFSTASSGKKAGRVIGLGLGVGLVGALGVQFPLAKYRTGYREYLETIPGWTGLLGVTLDRKPLLYLTPFYTPPAEVEAPQTEEVSEIPIYKEGDAAQPTLLESLPEEPVIAEVVPETVPEDVPEVIAEEVLAEVEPVPEPAKKKKRKKKKPLEEEVVVGAVVEEVVLAPVVDQTEALLEALSDEPAIVEEALDVVGPASEIVIEAVVEAAEAVEVVIGASPVEVVEVVEVVVAGVTIAVEEVVVSAEEVLEKVLEPADAAVVEVLEALVEQDDTEIILEALNSLDYEPILSDSILALLVGKSENREKAVMATISRLENAMSSVVEEVQKGLEHHNKISLLVSAAKSKADSVSKATDKKLARADWVDLIESSAAISAAFEEGEAVDAAAKASFDKLADVIERAAKFDLKAPVGAARALLSKSKNDFYTSCQTAQENQVDHALLAHYQKSVTNRKQVLKNELAILSEHFPNKVDSINRTFNGADGVHPAQLEELNTLITYLSSKVTRLEKEVTDQQAAELDKLKLAAEAQRMEDDKLLVERLKAQSEQLKYEHEMLRHAEVTQAVADAREDGYKQAEKQAKQHREELRTKLDRQNQDLTSFWSDEASLREAVVEADYQCKLEVANTTLAGVSTSVERQKVLYKDSQKNKRMLCLASELHNSVVEGEQIDIESVMSLSKQLNNEYAGDALISVVTAALPSTPLFSVTQLTKKFYELKASCKRSALAVDEDCGFGSSILSVVMSLITFDGAYTRSPSEGGSPTLYYLAKAEQELHQGNIDLAARYLNQLTGQPRAILTEWLVDARKLLELRQSTKVLLNYAQTKNMG